MQSAIYGFCVKSIKKISAFFPHSLFGKVFFAICSFIEQAAKDSIILGFFKNSSRSNAVFQESIFGKIFTALERVVSFISKKFSGRYQEIRSGSGILYFTDNWNLVSIRIYGTALFSFGIVYGILRLLTNSLTLKTFVFCLALIFSGICFILINRSLKSLFKGSTFLKTIGGLFYDNAANMHSRLFLADDVIHMRGTIASGIIGAALAVCAVILSPVYFAFAFFGVIFVLLVLKYTHMGVFITVVASPMLPASVLTVFCILCIVSLGFKLLRSKNINLVYSTLYIPVLLFALLYFLKALSSYTLITDTVQTLTYVVFILFYYVAHNILGNEKAYKATTSAFVITGGMIAVYGIILHFTKAADTLVLTEDFGFFDSPVYYSKSALSGFLIIIIPLCAAFFMRSEKTLHKVVYFGTSALCIICLILTWQTHRGAETILERLAPLYRYNIFTLILSICCFASFITVFIYFLKASAKALAHGRKKSLRRAVTAACMTGITALMLYSIKGLFYNHRIFLIFWIVLAVSTSKPVNVKGEAVRQR